MTFQSQQAVGGLPRTASLDVVIDFVNRLMLGRLNVTIDLTLNPSATTTTLRDPRIGAKSAIIEIPLTANAATAESAVWYSNFAKGSCTVNHASNAAVDQSFRFVILG